MSSAENAEPFPKERLKVHGGDWHGFLFENPFTDYPLTLTWGFYFDFGSLDWEEGSTLANLMVEWVHLPPVSWTDLSGVVVSCERFGEPIESSVYAYMHYKFDAVSVETTNQDGHRLHVRAQVSGDLDGLGASSVEAEGWLDFGGISVQPAERPSSGNQAVEFLAKHTDVAGLVAYDRGHNFLIGPPGIGDV